VAAAAGWAIIACHPQQGKIHHAPAPKAGPMNAGTTVIALVTDPDGYYIELIGKRG
jgi:hypothetical protein